MQLAQNFHMAYVVILGASDLSQPASSAEDLTNTIKLLDATLDPSELKRVTQLQSEGWKPHGIDPWHHVSPGCTVRR